MNVKSYIFTCVLFKKTYNFGKMFRTTTELC